MVIKDAKNQQKAFIKKYGWYAHYVFDDEKYPCRTNAHTHNIKESFNHKDIQVCLNIDPKIIHSLFVNIVENIKRNRV